MERFWNGGRFGWGAATPVGIGARRVCAWTAIKSPCYTRNPTHPDCASVIPSHHRRLRRCSHTQACPMRCWGYRSWAAYPPLPALMATTSHCRPRNEGALCSACAAVQGVELDCMFGPMISIFSCRLTQRPDPVALSQSLHRLLSSHVHVSVPE